MKYIIILTLFLSSFSYVYAEDSFLISQTVEQIKQNIQIKQEQFQLQIQDKRVEIKNQISQILPKNPEIQVFAQEQLFVNMVSLFEKFDAVLVKFDGVLTRISIRIQKLEALGVDVTKQKTLLAVAQDNLNQSFILIMSTKIELESTIKKSGISKEQVQSYIDECKESLKITQKSLIDVVSSLKIVGQNAGENLIFE